MVVNTNIGSLVAQSAANATNKSMDTAMERLSTGKRINSAADDAAGMAITSRLEAQSRGLSQAIRNAVDGQAMIDTTEGAHTEITNILQRLRELSVQSANDTNVAADRTNLQAEVTQLIAEIDRIATQTTWNGTTVLDGSFTSKQLQIGAQQGQSTTFSVDSARTNAIGNYALSSDAHSVAANSIDGEDLTIEGYLGAATIAVAASASVKDVAATINANSSSTGVSATAVTKAKLKTLSAAEAMAFTLTGDAAASISVTNTSTTHLGELKEAINAKSGVTGITAAFGSDTSELVLTHATGEDIAITGMDTATAGTTFVLEALDEDGAALSTPDTSTISEGGTATGAVIGHMVLSSIKSFTVAGDDATAKDGFFDTMNGTTAGGTAGLSNVASVNISTASGAASAIRAIDGAISKINSSRADLGGLSNRLDSTIANLTNIKTNADVSRSNIEDADFAAETSNLAKQQILSQAATSMLAQANQSKQSILALLQG
jgi:flagellin